MNMTTNAAGAKINVNTWPKQILPLLTGNFLFPHPNMKGLATRDYSLSYMHC